MTKAIMIQGAGSNVGKSLLVAGLARAFVRRGLRVAPFKSQNMSNNAAVTADGGEIGRAQALQARAAHLAPCVDMNPVLLKPETDIGAQVIVQGKHIATLRARDYGQTKSTLMPKVLESFHRLALGVDLVIIEGAGSPAEINLRAGDIANMGFAEAANVPVILVGDIDRGGVIAQLVGTYSVLPNEDSDRIKGFIVNKFRGDTSLFTQGSREISDRTGWQDLGVLPWFGNAWRLPAEDVLDISSGPKRDKNSLKIAVPRLNRISNFDDLDPLVNEPRITVEIIQPGKPLPGDADLVLIPGSKSTIADLADFRAQGWDIDLAAHIRRGGHVLGICGGYQMLGREIIDAQGIEGPPSRVPGLGHLDVVTQMSARKNLSLTNATYLPTGEPVEGYEIHLGKTHGPDCQRGFLQLQSRIDGATSADGLVRGCYLHGLFVSDSFRATYLAEIGGMPSDTQYNAGVDATLEQLADHLEAHLDLDLILETASKISPPAQ